METDYRELCLELFGTDDVKKLKALAARLPGRNARGAGRKRKFTPQEIEEMRALRSGGMTVQEIAERYHTSRQMVGKYLTPPMREDCTMRITYMYKQTPCTTIDVDFLDRKIYVDNKTDFILHRAFGTKEDPTWEDFEDFLKDRCFPPSRGNAKEILRDLGLDAYDPLQITEKTHGRMAEDNMWMKFYYRGRSVSV